MISPSSRYINIPYKGVIDSQQLSSQLNSMVSDISTLLNAIFTINNYLTNQAIYGFTVTFDSSTLIVSVSNGYTMSNGVQQHYAAMQTQSIGTVLNTGDIVCLDPINVVIQVVRSGTAVPASYIELAQYSGSTFDYSVRPQLQL